MIDVTAVQRWGRRPLFQAKIGTHPSTLVVVRGAPLSGATAFEVGRRIEFADHSDLRGCSKVLSPRWSWGIIWKIEDNRLYIDWM